MIVYFGVSFATPLPEIDARVSAVMDI
jgi:hypothetical protein